MYFDTVDEARQVRQILVEAGWLAEKEIILHHSRPRDPEIDEIKRVVKSAARRVYEEAIRLFGKPDPRYPNCHECIERSVFPFGPRHEASFSCQSGGRPHCTCDSCF